MPRTARMVMVDVPYHLTHRGNNRQAAFRDDDDFRRYLHLLRQYTQRHQLDVLAYCLMTTHAHVAGIPRHEDALACGFGMANGRYAQYANARYAQRGHFWEDRYHAFPIDASALVTVMRYVENNPVRAGMVPYAWEYPWSSAAAHLGAVDTSHLLDLNAWFSDWTVENWRSVLTRDEDPAITEYIRRHAHDGTLLKLNMVGDCPRVSCP